MYQLPPEARTVGMMRGGAEFVGWTPERYLDVAQVNLLTDLLYSFVSSKSKKKPQKPQHIETPDKQQKKADNLFAKQLQQQFDRLRT